MNRYSNDRWSNFDKFSTTLGRKPMYRSKSPYRSTSSLSRTSSTSNLKVDNDYFDALNKSLGAHDASFMHKDDNCSVKSGASGPNDSRYNSLPKKSNFNVNKLNKDYSTSKYRTKSPLDSSDYDVNNNYHYSSGGSGLGKGTRFAFASGSESDYEPLPSFSVSGLGRSYGASKGDDQVSESGSVGSDDSMSQYIHCKSFAPDSVSDSKLFHGLRASPISPTPSFQSHTQNSHQFDLSSELSSNDVQFVPIAKVQDQQAIRAAEFHPNGKFYAIGSNSKLLRVCQYSSHDTNNNNAADRSATDIPAPEEIYRRPRFHKGSIYCLTWNKLGNLLATGSNDKTIKMLTFNQETEKFRENEVELAMHDGTVRDLCFMDDLTNGSSLLLSGGAGDCKIYITDCETATTFLSLSGHSGTILSLYTWGGAMFVSGSQDRTIRFWDMRSNSCINFVTCPTISRTKPGGAVAAVSVDPSGKLLVSGHEDSTCMLYDIRGGRVIQTFHPHSADIRSIRFSNKAYYLLTGGYDNNIVLTDLQGDLTQPLRSVVVASHQDKVIQCRWHPTEFTFLSTSADKSTILWALPD